MGDTHSLWDLAAWVMAREREVRVLAMSHATRRAVLAELESVRLEIVRRARESES